MSINMASFTISDLVGGLEELAASPSGIVNLNKDLVLKRRFHDAVQTLLLRLGGADWMTQRLLYSPCEMTAAKIGVDLDLFNILEMNRRLTTIDLAQATGIEPDLLLRLLKFIASFGLIEELNTNLWTSSWATTTLARPSVAAGINHKHDNVMPAWHALPSWLKRHGYKSPTISTDTSFSQGHRIPADKTFFQFLKENPWNANEFNLFMKVHRSWRETWLDRPEVRNIFPQGPSNQRHYYEENNIERYQYVFVDVGGGIGQQCRNLIYKIPNLVGRIALQDLPAVISKADVGTKGRIEAMAVDFFEDQPITGARAYYLRSILRNWPDPQCHTILSHIHTAMSRDSFLLIDEIVMADFGASKAETQLDMTMLSMLNGQVRTEVQFRALLWKAGFEVLDVLFYQEQRREAVVVAKKKNWMKRGLSDEDD